MKTPQGFLNSGVYAVQETGSIYLKIGESDDIKSRLKELQTGNPRQLVVLAVLPEGNEKECHSRYGEYRVRGEWFLMSPPLAWVLYEEWIVVNRTEELMSLLKAYALTVGYEKHAEQEPLSFISRGSC